MRTVCISDTHGLHRQFDIFFTLSLEDSILIHAGDAANSRDPVKNEMEMRDFLSWFSSITAKVKIFVPGNHDVSIEAGLIDRNEWPNITFLIHESKIINDMKFFGSPYTPCFGNGWAWNMKRHRIGYVWNSIPDDTDVLITHGPPRGILDLAEDMNDPKVIEQCGCGSLMHRVMQLPNLRMHVFGHIHDDGVMRNYGTRCINGVTTFVNASVVDRRCNLIHTPILL